MSASISGAMTPTQTRRHAWKKASRRRWPSPAAQEGRNPQDHDPEQTYMTQPQLATTPLPDDLDLREELRVRMESTQGLTQAVVARESGVSTSTLSQWMAGTYPGKEENVRAKLEAWYQQLLVRQATSGLPTGPAWVDTASTKKILGVLRYAQMGPDMAIVYGGAGISKTKSADRYRKTAPNVWLATATPASSGVMAILEVIAETLGMKDYARTGAALHRQICQRLDGSAGLLILDEAQHLSALALDQVRSIHDRTAVGIVLMGNENVYGRMIGGTTRAAYLDRLYSRIGKKLHIKAPVADDVTQMAVAWGITDKACEKQLQDIARKPGAGGLRVLHKVLRLAASYAQAQKRTLCCDDVRAAAHELGVEA